MGAFNAGIYGYFTELDVVNLDGVVNGEVLDAMTDKALLAYVHRAGITHLVDHKAAYAAFMPFAEPEWNTAFELVDQFENSSSGGTIFLTRLKATNGSP